MPITFLINKKNEKLIVGDNGEYLRFVGEICRVVAQEEELVAARAIVHWERCEEDQANSESCEQSSIVRVILGQSWPLNDDVTRCIELAEVTSRGHHDKKD